MGFMCNHTLLGIPKRGCSTHHCNPGQRPPGSSLLIRPNLSTADAAVTVNRLHQQCARPGPTSGNSTSQTHRTVKRTSLWLWEMVIWDRIMTLFIWACLLLNCVDISLALTSPRTIYPTQNVTNATTAATEALTTDETITTALSTTQLPEGSSNEPNIPLIVGAAVGGVVVVVIVIILIICCVKKRKRRSTPPPAPAKDYGPVVPSSHSGDGAVGGAGATFNNNQFPGGGYSGGYSGDGTVQLPGLPSSSSLRPLASNHDEVDEADYDDDYLKPESTHPTRPNVPEDEDIYVNTQVAPIEEAPRRPPAHGGHVNPSFQSDEFAPPVVPPVYPRHSPTKVQAVRPFHLDEGLPIEPPPSPPRKSFPEQDFPPSPPPADFPTASNRPKLNSPRKVLPSPHQFQMLPVPDGNGLPDRLAPPPPANVTSTLNMKKELESKLFPPPPPQKAVKPGKKGKKKEPIVLPARFVDPNEQVRGSIPLASQDHGEEYEVMGPGSVAPTDSGETYEEMSPTHVPHKGARFPPTAPRPNMQGVVDFGDEYEVVEGEDDSDPGEDYEVMDVNKVADYGDDYEVDFQVGQGPYRPPSNIDHRPPMAEPRPPERPDFGGQYEETPVAPKPKKKPPVSGKPQLRSKPKLMKKPTEQDFGQDYGNTGTSQSLPASARRAPPEIPKSGTIERMSIEPIAEEPIYMNQPGLNGSNSQHYHNLPATNLKLPEQNPDSTTAGYVHRTHLASS